MTAPPTGALSEDSSRWGRAEGSRTPANGGRNEVEATSRRPEADCAAAHAGRAHWPAQLPLPEFVGKTYNCLVFEFGGEGLSFTAVCADLCGMYGNGESSAAALADLRGATECHIEAGGGGVYPDTSSPRFQEADAAALERYWAEDGVAVLSRRRARPTLFAPNADRDWRPSSTPPLELRENKTDRTWERGEPIETVAGPYRASGILWARQRPERPFCLC